MRPRCCVLVAVSPDEGGAEGGGIVGGGPGGAGVGGAGVGGAGSGARSSCAQPKSIEQASAATRYGEGPDRGSYADIADSSMLKPELYNGAALPPQSASRKNPGLCRSTLRPLPTASMTGCCMRQRSLSVDCWDTRRGLHPNDYCGTTRAPSPAPSMYTRCPVLRLGSTGCVTATSTPLLMRTMICCPGTGWSYFFWISLPKSAPPSVPATIATSRPVPPPIRLPMPSPPRPPTIAPTPR